MKLKSLFSLLLAFGSLSTSLSIAQSGANDMTYKGGNYDILDSTYIPKGRMKQQNEFLNYQ